MQLVESMESKYAVFAQSDASVAPGFVPSTRPKRCRARTPDDAPVKKRAQIKRKLRLFSMSLATSRTRKRKRIKKPMATDQAQQREFIKRQRDRKFKGEEDLLLAAHRNKMVKFQSELNAEEMEVLKAGKLKIAAAADSSSSSSTNQS
jgi:hypothetical protein